MFCCCCLFVCLFVCCFRGVGELLLFWFIGEGNIFELFEGVTYSSYFCWGVFTISSQYCNASITETLFNMAPDTSDVGRRPYTANKMS